MAQVPIVAFQLPKAEQGGQRVPCWWVADLPALADNSGMLATMLADPEQVKKAGTLVNEILKDLYDA